MKTNTNALVRARMAQVAIALAASGCGIVPGGLVDHELSVVYDGQGTVSIEPAGSIFKSGTQVTLTATPAEGFRFGGWGKDVERPEDPNIQGDDVLTISMDSDITITVMFVPQHTLTTTTVGDGDVEPAGGTFDDGQEITLIATPANGYRFGGWESTSELSVDDTSNPELILTVADEIAITAVFVAQYALTTMVSGHGAVEPEGDTFDEGTILTLLAIPEDGFAFDRWEGDVTSSQQAANPLTVTTDQDLSVTAVFVPLYDIVVNIEGNGTVDTRAATLKEGSMLTLTATPDDGSEFLYWSDDASGTQNPLVVIVGDDLAITAVFAEFPVLTVDIQGQGTVSPSGGRFEKGTRVTLTATADTGYVFNRWLGDVPPGQEESNPVDLELAQDRSVAAVFMEGIRPGLGLDRVNLGDSAHRAMRRLGQPDGVAPDPNYWVNYLLYETLGIAVVVEDLNRDWYADDREPVVFIFAITPFSGAYRGLGIGSSWNDIKQAMGSPEEIDRSYHSYCAHGIVWTVENGTVSEVAVTEPFNCANINTKPIAAAKLMDDMREQMLVGAKAALRRAE